MNIFRAQKPSAQDVQDKIFRKMSADQKLKLTGDFSMFVLKNKIPHDARISMSYLEGWLKKEKIFAKFRKYFK